jgi:hypothetical protein
MVAKTHVYSAASEIMKFHENFPSICFFLSGQHDHDSDSNDEELHNSVASTSNITTILQECLDEEHEAQKMLEEANELIAKGEKVRIKALQKLKVAQERRKKANSEIQKELDRFEMSRNEPSADSIIEVESDGGFEEVIDKKDLGSPFLSRKMKTRRKKRKRKLVHSRISSAGFALCSPKTLAEIDNDANSFGKNAPKISNSRQGEKASTLKRALEEEISSNQFPKVILNKFQEKRPRLTMDDLPFELDPFSRFFICEICDDGFLDRSEMQKHMLIKHEVDIDPYLKKDQFWAVSCHICPDARFYSGEGLKRHYLCEHGLVTKSMEKSLFEQEDCGR